VPASSRHVPYRCVPCRCVCFPRRSYARGWPFTARHVGGGALSSTIPANLSLLSVRKMRERRLEALPMNRGFVSTFAICGILPGSVALSGSVFPVLVSILACLSAPALSFESGPVFALAVYIVQMVQGVPHAQEYVRWW